MDTGLNSLIDEKEIFSLENELRKLVTKLILRRDELLPLVFECRILDRIINDIQNQIKVLENPNA